MNVEGGVFVYLARRRFFQEESMEKFQLEKRLIMLRVSRGHHRNMIDQIDEEIETCEDRLAEMEMADERAGIIIE